MESIMELGIGFWRWGMLGKIGVTCILVWAIGIIALGSWLIWRWVKK